MIETKDVQLSIVKSTTGGGYFVQSGSAYSDGLTPDEALGVVASILFGSGPPLYLRTESQNRAWNEHLARMQEKNDPPLF